MTKEIGPREKALREMRESKLHFAADRARAAIADLKKTVAVAAKKRGRPRKAKK